MDRRHPHRSARPLVLVVDQHDDTRELYLQSLLASGFDAVGAADGQQACRRARESRLGVVVLDLPRHDDDGWQLLQDLRRAARARYLPVVLIAAHAAPSLRDRAQRERCAAFFVKPCLPDELASELRQIVDRTPVYEGLSTSC